MTHTADKPALDDAELDALVRTALGRVQACHEDSGRLAAPQGDRHFSAANARTFKELADAITALRQCVRELESKQMISGNVNPRTFADNEFCQLNPVGSRHDWKPREAEGSRYQQCAWCHSAREPAAPIAPDVEAILAAENARLKDEVAALSAHFEGSVTLCRRFQDERGTAESALAAARDEIRQTEAIADGYREERDAARAEIKELEAKLANRT